MQQNISDLTAGCFVLAFKDKRGNVEAVSMHKFPKACSKMISREHLFSLQIRFLSKEERDKVEEKWLINIYS